MKSICTAATLLALHCGVAAADITVEADLKLTGGSGAGLMRLWGTYSPTRIASGVAGQYTRIIDVDKKTITDLHVDQKTYQIQSFDQFAAKMSQSEQTRQALAAQGMLISAQEQRFDIKEGTEVAPIAGIQARQMFFTSESAVASQKGELWLGMAPEGFEAARSILQAVRERLTAENAWPDDWFNHLESQLGALGLSLKKTPAELADVMKNRIILRNISIETKKAAEIPAALRAVYGKQYEKMQAEMNKRAAAVAPVKTTIEITSLSVSTKPPGPGAVDIPEGFTEFRMPEPSASDKKKMEEMMKAREKAMQEMMKRKK